MRRSTAAVAAILAFGCLTVLAGTAAAGKAPLLGSKAYSGPYGAGFGAVKPKRIYNGGVVNGEVHNIDKAENRDD